MPSWRDVAHDGVLGTFINRSAQGVTKRCSLSWLTKSALLYEAKCMGGRGSCGVSANECSCTPEPKYVNFGDLIPYLTYGSVVWSVRAGGMDRPSRTKLHHAGLLSSSQPGGPPCWASPLAFGLIDQYFLKDRTAHAHPKKTA